MEGNTAGFYTSHNNIIELNFKYHPNISEHFEKLFSINNIKDRVKYLNTNMQYLFKVSKIPTTLMHELCHAWSDKDEGYHDVMELMINGKISEYKFDEASSTIYNLIVEMGLITKWLQ